MNMMTPIEERSNEFASSLAGEMSKGIGNEYSCYEARYKAETVIMGMGLPFVEGSSSGCYALSIVEHPDIPERVYKVCMANPSYDPYILYAEWIYNNRMFDLNPHFPRIHSLTYSEDGRLAIISMEKLEEFNWYSAPIWLQHDWRLYWNICFDPDRQFNPHPIIDLDYRNRPLETASRMIYDRFVSIPSTFLDSHKGNVMLRGDIMVMIDPLALS